MTAHLQAGVDFTMLARVAAGTAKARGISYRSVAREIGASPSTVTRVMAGSGCDLAAYVALCQWMGVSLDTFVKTGPTP